MKVSFYKEDVYTEADFVQGRYIEELKKALYDKCDSIGEFLFLLEEIEGRVYGAEETAAEERTRGAA